MNQRLPLGPGQESVWDYPRPPRVASSTKLIQVILNGTLIAESRHTLRVLETSHPPVYYIPPLDVRLDQFTPTERQTICEFKGTAHYLTIQVGDVVVTNGAWRYPDPTPAYAALRDYLAIYPGNMEACFVDGVPVKAQPGDFYGGWITPDIIGPFKGPSGTETW